MPKLTAYVLIWGIDSAPSLSGEQERVGPQRRVGMGDRSGGAGAQGKGGAESRGFVTLGRRATRAEGSRHLGGWRARSKGVCNTGEGVSQEQRGS